MRRVNLMCLVAVFLTAGLASANTVWNPTDANDIAAGFANWDVAANWTAGLPGDTDQKPVFTEAGDAVECRVTTDTLPFTGNMTIGEGSATNAVVRVMDGGTITRTNVGDWCGLGYNATGRLIVEEGGQVIFGSHLWMGASNGGHGTLDVNGGYVDIDDALDLGRKLTDANNEGGLGFINLNSGMVRFRYYPDFSDNPGSLCNIKFGTLAMENNYTGDNKTKLDDRIAAGTLVGFGGDGTLVITRENVNGDNLTLVKAISPMDPFPAYDETIAVSDVPTEAYVDLMWTNLEPNSPGDSVWVDVWFGTDPNKMSLAYTKEVDAGENTTTVQVLAPVVGAPPTTYYWQVDSYIYGPGTINEPNMIEGDVFKFHVKDDLPPTVEIVDPNVPTQTWAGPAGTVPLTATVSDTGSSAVTVVWTASDPNAVFTNEAYTYPTATADVSVDYAAGDVTVTCTVSDAANPAVENSDSLLLNVAADECAAAIDAGADYPMDLVGDDCVVDIADLTELVSQWLDDFTLDAPIPIVE